MSNDKVALHEEQWIENLAIKIFSDIESLTRDKVGISRESYGKGEALSINYLIDLAEEFGFYVEQDDAANVILSLDKSGGSPDKIFLLPFDLLFEILGTASSKASV